MKPRNIIIALLTVSYITATAAIRPIKLTCEYLENPMTIDAQHPRLSWINIADKNENDQWQTAWQIQVASLPQSLAQGKADLWDSGRTDGNTSTIIPYIGKALRSGQDCYWRVRVWDKNGKASAWSNTANWHMGLLDKSDWKAQWIGAPWDEEDATIRSKDKNDKPAPLLRKRFDISKNVKKAHVYVSGLGYFELYMNGKKVGDDVLVPNQTDYTHRPDIERKRVRIDNNFKGYRVLYVCYDVKPYLRKGNNAIGCLLGCGFFNSFNPGDFIIPYASPRIIAQIEIEYNDGTKETICSNTSWEVKKSFIVSNGIYTGEHADGRLIDRNWCCSTEGWQQAVERKSPDGQLEAQMAYSDRVNKEMKPLSIQKISSDKWFVDFGEEIAGWIHLKKMNGKPGQRIDIHYIYETNSPIPNKNSNASPGNENVPPQGTNSYTLNGNKNEDYHAHFAWFVFSKVIINGWEGELKADQITAEDIHTELPQTAHFACSDTLINKIQKIWCRSLLDNTHGGIFSDCPHRERIGYTGDGQVACETVMYNYDGRAVYTKWMRDILLAQNPTTGYVPNAAPWESGAGGGPEWGAAMIIIPYTFYQMYHDADILNNNYKGMVELMKYFRNWVDEDGIMLHNYWDWDNPMAQWLNLGEWCAPTSVLPRKALIHTYYYWLCARDISRIAAAIGKYKDAKQYEELAEHTRKAFHKRFYDRDLHTYGEAGSNIFALDMGIDNRNQLGDVLNTLKNELKRNNGHLNTGIFGTKLFFEVLTRYGLNEEAYEAMTKTDFPSFGNWIRQGATTTWEQWDGGASHNHPMFGGGLTWLYRCLAGVDIDFIKNGDRHFVIKPCPPKNVDWAEYSNETPYGKVAVRWDKTIAGYKLQIIVPVGCTATVIPPGKDGVANTRQVKSGNYIIDCL